MTDQDKPETADAAETPVSAENAEAVQPASGADGDAPDARWAAPDAADAPVEEDLYQELEQARAKADEHWDMYLRMAADLDNYRRRVERELTNAHKFGVEKFAGEMLNVVDSLELGLRAAADNPTVESLNEGMTATLRLLSQTLGRFGVTEVDPLGERFDPERHEAVAVLPSDANEPDSILEVIQKGFTLHERLLRPARVVVTKAGDDG